jgi:hypothetical protein
MLDLALFAPRRKIGTYATFKKLASVALAAWLCSGQSLRIWNTRSWV